MSNPARDLSGNVGVYRITSRLHEGGDGIIYRALDPSGEQPVAIKLPRQRDGHAIQAFLAEVASLQLLNRAGVRGVVQLLASGYVDDLPWYAMSWVDGCDLGTQLRTMRAQRPMPLAMRDRAARGDAPDAVTRELPQVQSAALSVSEAGLPPPDASSGGWLDGEALTRSIQLIRDIAGVLSDVHAQGLLHGDLSPSNIMLGVNDTPTLLDFGSAWRVFEPGRAREVAAVGRRRRATPGYAAPEVFLDQLIDSRCDIYSLGCIAFEALTGKRPFDARTPEELVRQHLHRPLTLPPASAELPEPLLVLLGRMLEKDRTRRIPHAIEVAEELSRWASDSRAIVGGSRSVGVFRPRLAGRDGVIARMQNLFEDARRGRGGLVILRGASGHGKTRLLNELGLEAERSGSEVIVCRCSQAARATGRGEPAPSSGLEVFAPLLQRIGSEAAAGALSQGGADDAESLLVELSSVEPYSPAPLVPGGAAVLPSLSASAAAERMCRSLASLLRRLARTRSLVLLIDDLQWVDHLSARFLSNIAEELATTSAIAVCAMRDEAGYLDVDRLRGNCRVEEVLAPLAADDVAGLVRDLLGADMVPDGFMEFVLRYSEGAPFYVAEYTRAALREGWLVRRGSSQWDFVVPPTNGALEGLAKGIDQILLERTSDLSLAARETLEFAAVLGREFDEVDLLESSDPDTARASIRELMARELLFQPEPGRYRFCHDAIRDAHERALHAARRRELHHLAAQLVARKTFTREVQRSARLGHHLAASGDPARALRHLERAATEALRENSLTLAADLYRAAREQSALSGAGAAQLAELSEALGDVLITLARHAEARNRYREALTLRVQGSPLVRARVWRKLAASCWTLHEYDEAGRALLEAEQELLHDPQETLERQRELIQVKMGRFEQLYFAQQKGPAIERVLGELRELVESHGTDAQKVTYYIAASSQASLRSRYAFDAEAVSLAERAVRASAALALEQQAMANFVHAFTLIMGTPEQCVAALPGLDAAARAAEAAFATTLTARIAAYRALSALRRGDVAATIMAANSARAAAESAQQTPYLAMSIACAGWAAWRRGAPDGRDLLERAHQMWLSHPHPFPLRWIASFPLLAFAVSRDDFEQAKFFLDDLLDERQLALPADLDAAVRAAASACATGPARVAAAELERALRLAQARGFC